MSYAVTVEQQNYLAEHPQRKQVLVDWIIRMRIFFLETGPHDLVYVP